MRIALFTDTGFPDVNGVARTLSRLVDHIVARGHEVALVSPHPDAPAHPGVQLHLRMPGIPAPFYPELRLCRPLNRGERGRLEAFAPDLVHVATEATIGRSGRRWALRRRLPFVTSFHTHFPAYLAGYGLGWAEPALWSYLRAFHRPALRTFAPSGATCGLLRSRGFHDRLTIWSRGVDATLFDPARRRESVRARIAPGAERILVYAGRLAPEKRVHLLLDALPGIQARTRLPLALVIVGDGPAAPELRARAIPGVHFTGYLSGVSLAEVYAAGDLFVFPSDTETFGNVVLEALASGLPAVVPSEGGVLECVRNGENGTFFTPRDAQSLRDRVVEVLSDGARLEEMGRAARSTALERSWPAILDGLLGAWGQVLAEQGRQPPPS